MSPLALPDTAARPRNVESRRSVESISRHDIRLRHLPPNLYGLYVNVTEAELINASLRLVGLETDLRDGLFRRATKTRWGQNEGRS